MYLKQETFFETISLCMTRLLLAGCRFWRGQDYFFLIRTLRFDSSAQSSDFFTGILISHYPSEFNTLISVHESGLYPRLVCSQEREKRQRLGISD